MTYSITTLGITQSIVMLSVTYKLFMLSVILLNVVMINGIMLNVVVMSVVALQLIFPSICNIMMSFQITGFEKAKTHLAAKRLLRGQPAGVKCSSLEVVVSIRSGKKQ